MKRYRLLIVAAAMIVGGFVGLLVGSSGLAGGPGGLSGPAAKGARIFYAATDSSGQPIPYRGGMMMRVACASCHGPDGRGLATPMFVSPNITYRNLIDPAGMLEPNGDRGPTYTDETIKRAITQGTSAEDQPLQWPMPRWRMSDPDLDDLISFLKTLP